MRYLFGFMCVLALGVVGCGETAGTGGLEGTWQFESMEVREMTADCPGEIVIIPVVWVCPEGTYTFNGNDTFVAVGEAYGNDPPNRAKAPGLPSATP